MDLRFNSLGTNDLIALSLFSLKILMYGTYYEAFNSMDEQYVGGGADVISLSWPD